MCCHTGLDVMDDDSGKLAEVVELFSDITLPLKVDKLVKVSFLPMSRLVMLPLWYYRVSLG